MNSVDQTASSVAASPQPAPVALPSPIVRSELSGMAYGSPTPSSHALRHTPLPLHERPPTPVSCSVSRPSLLGKPSTSRSRIHSQVLSDSDDDETLTVPEFPSPEKHAGALDDPRDHSIAHLTGPIAHRQKRHHSAVLFALEEALRAPYSFTPDTVEEEARISEPCGIQLPRSKEPDVVVPEARPIFRAHRRVKSQPLVPPSASRTAFIRQTPKPAIAVEAMSSRHQAKVSTNPAPSAPASGIKSPTQVMKARQDRERRRAEQKEQDSMMRDQEKRHRAAAEHELRLQEEAKRRSAERKAAAAAGGATYQSPISHTQSYMSASNAQPNTPRSRAGFNPTGETGSPDAGPSTQALPTSFDTAKKHSPNSQSKSSFPHAFERWETLSAQWEGVTRHWIRRLEMNGTMLESDPLSKTLSRQVTDLSAAGANLFHAVVELQRLRASSERKFQRWFFETRGELERIQEEKAQLEAALRDEQNTRREKAVQAQNTETVNILQRQLAEMKKELTISKEEARRAWEELGRREQEERERTFSLQNGQPTIVGGVQVVPMSAGNSRRDHLAHGQSQAQPQVQHHQAPQQHQQQQQQHHQHQHQHSTGSYTPPHQPPTSSGSGAASGYPAETDSHYHSGYVLDAAGNELLDSRGRPIPYETTGSPLSHADIDEYNLPSSRGGHQGPSQTQTQQYQSMTSTVVTSSSAQPPSSSAAQPAAGQPASAVEDPYSGAGWDIPTTHQHPTRLSDVPEEEESRTTTASHVSRG
ncbi:uncharacterized protein BROUX77_004030 [Berkeleyomyces rouxiae]|uniref:uncharacterized protein n=1 Tax=Berkeleyomyces rouxiae TaxID=2035830 RepID=UPI003B7D2E90